MRAIAALLVANLPLRWWGPFEDRLPLHQMAWLSAVLVMLAGFAIGIPGYLAFMQDASAGFNAAIGVNPDIGIKSTGWGLAALPIFMFATPLGLVASYLGFSGFVRAVSAFLANDVQGDFILTGLDAAVRRAWGRTDAYDKRRTREKLEGPEMPDRLLKGEQIGRPDVELVVLASRRKSDWETNSYLVLADGTAFRIGQSFDYRTSAGLRTAYPLTQLRGGEAIRHSISYELPPLWRGRDLRGGEINN